MTLTLVCFLVRSLLLNLLLWRHNNLSLTQFRPQLKKIAGYLTLDENVISSTLSWNNIISCSYNDKTESNVSDYYWRTRFSDSALKAQVKYQESTLSHLNDQITTISNSDEKCINWLLDTFSSLRCLHRFSRPRQSRKLTDWILRRDFHIASFPARLRIFGTNLSFSFSSCAAKV